LRKTFYMRALLIILLITSQSTYAQIVDRYNYVQKPTETGVTIAWRTASSSIGTITWGVDAFNLTNTETETSATQKHFFDITGLTPNTKYYYQTTTDGGFTSAIDFFYTAKADSNKNFSFLHYGDCGYNNTIQNDIATLMIGDSTDFGVVTGDVDQGNGDKYDEVFFGPYKDLVKNSCQFTCIGNHDTYADNAATYIDAFYMPTNNPQQSERYYSYTWGNAKFICLDANIAYQIGSDQHSWMLDELKCNDRQWLFVFFHQPPWTNAWSADYYLPFSPYFLYEGNEDMRTDLVPYFEQYDVDFVLNGHSHCYQRGELNGVKYIISGGAGASTLDANKTSDAPNIQVEIYENQYVRFDITGDTATYVSININDIVSDSVTTIKTFTSYTPEISLNGQEITSTTGSNYVWFLDGMQISETAQSFTPSENGTYEVMTTNQHGCSYTSEPFHYDLLSNSIDEIDLSELNIFPNPSNNIITITGNENGFSGQLNFKIYDAMGKLVFQKQINIDGALKHQLNIEEFNNGIYLLEMSCESNRFSKRIIKE